MIKIDKTDAYITGLVLLIILLAVVFCATCVRVAKLYESSKTEKIEETSQLSKEMEYVDAKDKEILLIETDDGVIEIPISDLKTENSER